MVQGTIFVDLRYKGILGPSPFNCTYRICELWGPTALHRPRLGLHLINTGYNRLSLCTCEKAAENGAFGSCFRHPFHHAPTRPFSGLSRSKIIGILIAVISVFSNNAQVAVSPCYAASELISRSCLVVGEFSGTAPAASTDSGLS
jgi:hypothetical protein